MSEPKSMDLRSVAVKVETYGGEGKKERKVGTLLQASYKKGREAFKPCGPLEASGLLLLAQAL